MFLTAGLCMGDIFRPKGTFHMVSFLSDRVVLSTLLYSIAVVIAFGPELRHSVARIRANESALGSEASTSETD